MCGIAGFSGSGSKDDIVKMTSVLKHRGPDAEGFFIDQDNSVFLGHRRLSIIDIKDGAQPMIDQEKKLIITFNGEIYNHLELRKELEAKGHTFITDHSDTEVLLHGYKECSKSCS